MLVIGRYRSEPERIEPIRNGSLTHLLTHLPPRQADLVVALLEPVPLRQAAESIGVTRTTACTQWQDIKATLGLLGGDTTGAVARVALVRMAFGLDPCVCRGGR